MKMWQRKTDSSGVIQMDLKKLEGIFEGMLFASGDKVSIEKLSSITGIDKKTVKLVINNMIVKYFNLSNLLFLWHCYRVWLVL